MSYLEFINVPVLVAAFYIRAQADPHVASSVLSSVLGWTEGMLTCHVVFLNNKSSASSVKRTAKRVLASNAKGKVFLSVRSFYKDLLSGKERLWIQGLAYGRREIAATAITKQSRDRCSARCSGRNGVATTATPVKASRRNFVNNYATVSRTNGIRRLQKAYLVNCHWNVRVTIASRYWGWSVISKTCRVKRKSINIKWNTFTLSA